MSSRIAVVTLRSLGNHPRFQPPLGKDVGCNEWIPGDHSLCFTFVGRCKGDEATATVGERATNMARVFNAREGFTRKDDTLPERLFSTLDNGALKGKVYPQDEFESALTVLYGLKGWDPTTGTPTRQRLESLALGWAADLFD